MEHIEIILRTTASSGKVTEQLLVRFDTENLAIERDKVLEYSGLCIDPDKHQVSYQGSVLPLTETYEFQTLVYLASQPRRVFTKEQIYQAVWKEEPVDVSTQKLKYKIIVAQDIVGVKCKRKLDIDLSGRIYPDRVGSRIQICGCPRGVILWDVSSGKIIKTAKIEKIAEFLILILVEG